MTYTGLSLSFCVRDIVNGRVPLDQVDKIIASTRASSRFDWDDLIKEYKKVYWSEKPDECEQLARQLIDAGMIEQPRLKGKEAHNIAAGHWIVDGQQVRL